MILRPEAAADVEEIRHLTARAFNGHPHGDGSEPEIIDRLRDAGALTLSLVAEDEGALVGHVAFSPVVLSDGTPGWFGLGPLSVDPGKQRFGIGSALVRAGLHELAAAGAKGCVVMGDPDYYTRFGFKADGALVYPGCAPQYFLNLPLSGPPASGIVAYNPAFAPGTPD